MNEPATMTRSRWLALRNAISDPRWRTASAIKRRQAPYCELRVRCNGAAAAEIVPISWSIGKRSYLDPANLQSACPACYQWKLGTAALKVHF